MEFEEISWTRPDGTEVPGLAIVSEQLRGNF
jgi:hypothetical protein